jgi:hypothetical protein
LSKNHLAFIVRVVLKSKNDCSEKSEVTLNEMLQITAKRLRPLAIGSVSVTELAVWHLFHFFKPVNLPVNETTRWGVYFSWNFRELRSEVAGYWYLGYRMDSCTLIQVKVIKVQH